MADASVAHLEAKLKVNNSVAVASGNHYINRGHSHMFDRSVNERMKVWKAEVSEKENLLDTVWARSSILAETFDDALEKFKAAIKTDHANMKGKLEITKLELVDEIDIQ